MKWYAATDEYQMIYPLTIRDTAEAAISEAERIFAKKWEALERDGICLASYEQGNGMFPVFAQPGHGVKTTWVRGFRSKDSDNTANTNLSRAEPAEGEA